MEDNQKKNNYLVQNLISETQNSPTDECNNTITSNGLHNNGPSGNQTDAITTFSSSATISKEQDPLAYVPDSDPNQKIAPEAFTPRSDTTTTSKENVSTGSNINSSLPIANTCSSALAFSANGLVAGVNSVLCSEFRDHSRLEENEMETVLSTQSDTSHEKQSERMRMEGVSTSTTTHVPLTCVPQLTIPTFYSYGNITKRRKRKHPGLIHQE